ncbi:MAG: rhodanese-like domain-containing protein [Gordonia paraffinivorans]
MTGPRSQHLVSARELLTPTSRRTVVLDVRVDGDGRPDPAAHRARRVPGSRFVDLDRDLSGPPTPAAGARPLPRPADLTRSLRRWGIGRSTTVVVLDATTSAAAARAWWVLRWAGLTDVRVLDGGLRAWVAAGGALETGAAVSSAARVADHVTADHVTAVPGAMPTVDIDDVALLAGRGLLLDARPSSAYQGRDGSPGHIPGAVSAPVFADHGADGTLLPEEDLRCRYGTLGVATGHPTMPIASYCGSGVAAALQVLHLATLGIEAALYPGSLSQWTSDPARLVVGACITPRVDDAGPTRTEAPWVATPTAAR